MTIETIFASFMQFASLFAIACCIFLVSSLITSGIFLAHRRYIQPYPLKSGYLFFHGFCAVLATLVVSVWLSLSHSPSLPFVFEHCHSSNCAAHIPAVIDPALLNLLFAFFVIGFIGVCTVFIKIHQNRLQERIDSLLRLTPNQDANNPYWAQATIVEIPQPTLINVGLFIPKLLLSSAITRSLKNDDAQLLLGYEYAKAKQFENLKVKLLQISCLFWPATARSQLISDLQSVIHVCAIEGIRLQHGHQQTQIPPDIFNNMSNELREFLSNISGTDSYTSQSHKTKQMQPTANNIAYFFSGLYFMCLVIVTSNFTHFLFELIK
ncbi:MAG: hypothetical protein ABJK37_00590 [Paraglaciecola sp.]|uniref:hypothetical protein n=1 Tax=Paraglaciecola sp. TaxID=1920173 RepID=UPI0032973F8F